MSKVRERSAGPASVPPRMLRIEYEGQPYDWFNLDEMGDIVRTNDFSNTLRENITHYFGVPYEYQAIYDEEGLLSSMIDFSRALRSVRPWLRVYDAREMKAELKEKTTKQLEEIHSEILRSQRTLSSWSDGAVATGMGAPEQSMGSTGTAQQLFSPKGQNGQFSQRDPSMSLADAVKNASESGGRGGPSQFTAPQHVQPPTAFPWAGAALEAYSMPQVGSGASPRYPTPPAQNVHSQMPVHGMVGPQAFPGPSSWGRAGPAALGPNLHSQPAPMQLFPPMGQRQMPPGYGGAPALGSGLPQATRAIGSSTPPMPLSSRGVGPSSTPPQPPTGATAAAALGLSADRGGYSSRPPTQRDIQVGSDQNAQATDMIEVALSKEPGFERFGFANVPTRDNRALVVSWVDSAGLLEMKWNRMVQASQQVMEGYKILSVNGRSDNVEAMRDQLQMSKVQLIVQRANSPTA